MTLLEQILSNKYKQDKLFWFYTFISYLNIDIKILNFISIKFPELLTKLVVRLTTFGYIPPIGLRPKDEPLLPTLLVT
jgi:hypothetical protein